MKETAPTRPEPAEPTTWLTIRMRILLLTALLVTVMVAIGATNWLAVRWLAQNADLGNSQVARSLHMVNLSRAVQVDFKKQVQEWKNMLLRGNDPQQMKKYLRKFEAQEATVREGLRSLRALLAEAGMDTDTVDRLLRRHAELGQAYRKAVAGYDGTERDSAFRVDRQVKGIDRSPTQLMEQVVNDILAARMAQVSGAHASEARRFDYVQWIVAALTVLGLLLAMGSAWLLIRTVVKPLEAVLQQTRTVARGDLTQKVETTSRDEIGRLMHAAEEMRRNLGNVIRQIQRIGKDVSHAAGEIAAGNRRLADRTVQQAASLETTGSNMQEVTTLVNQNAETAREAHELAQKTGATVLQSAAVVEDVAKAMQDIRDTSRNIADIVGVIDEIAFQTNLLALNAAVEAAHAGEQGKGFAVVAAEVRNLAQRSAAAASQINGLIADSVAKVDSGAKLADRSGEALHNVVREFEAVSDLISNIATAASEQAIGVDGVTREVAHMEQMTQENSAMVRAVSELSESMEARARELERLASYFRVASAHEGGGRAAAPPAPAAEARTRPARPAAERRRAA